MVAACSSRLPSATVAGFDGYLWSRKENPCTEQLIQGGYQWDWIQKQQAATANCSEQKMPRHRATSPTRASLGHQHKAGKGAGAPDTKAFIMPRFQHVPARVNVWSASRATVPPTAAGDAS